MLHARLSLLCNSLVVECPTSIAAGSTGRTHSVPRAKRCRAHCTACTCRFRTFTEVSLSAAPVGSFRSGRTKGNICRKLWRELLDQIVRGEPALQTCAVLYCVTACCAVYVACACCGAVLSCMLCSMLRAACCTLYAARCLLHVVCCVLRAAHRHRILQTADAAMLNCARLYGMALHGSASRLQNATEL